MKMRKPSNNDSVATLRKNVELLYKAVYQGNGSPSIVTQITRLNEQVESLEEKVDARFKALDTEMGLKFKNVTDVVTEKFSSLSDQINSEFTKEKNVLDKKWSHKTAIFTGILASFTSITVVIVSEVIKRLH
jgi:seryl-tRNA synthetase